MASAKVQIKDGLDGAGRTGVMYFSVRPAREGVSGHEWAIVLWDDEQQLVPSLHKRSELVPA